MTDAGEIARLHDRCSDLMRRPYRFHDERQSTPGRGEVWMDAAPARAVRTARRGRRGFG